MCWAKYALAGGYRAYCHHRGKRLSGHLPFFWRSCHVSGAKRAAAAFSIPGDTLPPREDEPPPLDLFPILGREGGHFIRQAMRIP